MSLRLFKAKPAADVGEALIASSATPLTIPEMLADGAARYGDRTAYQQKFDAEWRRVSFEQTWRRANEFAAGLIALGLQKGDRMALICENGLEWAIGYYGLSIAGGVGVPLYTELRRGEVEERVHSSGARIVLASTRVLQRLGGQPEGADNVIVVGGEETRQGNPPGFLRRGRPDLLPFDQVAALATDASRAELARRHVAPDDLASLVYTSGTTGGMKGVMLTHKNFMSNVESARRSLQFDEKDRMVMVLPMHHALPFIIFLVGFTAGGEMTFENDLLRVRDRLGEVKPTVFIGVPALFEQMYRTIVRRAETEGRLEMFQRGLRVVDVAKRRTGVNLGRLVFREVHQQVGGHLRWVLSGGAALKPEVARNFFRLGLPLIQGWGLSEAAPVVSTQRWMPRKFFFSNYYEEHAGSVGQAIDGVEVKLIDVPDKGIYVHLHGEGELVVRGPNVFAGYWQAEEETRAVMADGWLRTGDLGRIDEEGNIWITGRSKYVIVLDSGEKVVPDEVEDQLGASELLQDICIVPHRGRGKTLIGAIVYPNVEETVQRLEARGEQPSEETVTRLIQEELEAFAKELAPYKRVSSVTLTDTPLPKTAILKVMRGQLPETFTFDLERWRESGALPAPADDDTASAGSQ